MLHGTRNAYVNKKTRNRSKFIPKAIIMVSKEEGDTFNRAPTEVDIAIQDREGMNTIFLMKSGAIQGSCEMGLSHSTLEVQRPGDPKTHWRGSLTSSLLT